VTLRLCIFGDSHFACVKLAERQGLVDMTGIDLEYWGHVGRRFLYLRPRAGGIDAADDFTARRFAKFNEKGRLCLEAADFDAILVVGARIHVEGLFLRLVPVLHHGPFASESLQVRLARDHLHRQFGYRLALGLRASATTRVLVAATSFRTEAPEPGPEDPAPAPAPVDVPDPATPQDRAAIWQGLVRAAAQDRIELLPQPDETVARDLTTRAEFAVDRHLEKRDFAHRNVAYGRLVLDQAVQALRSGPGP
jgi:hypothetical protein